MRNRIPQIPASRSCPRHPSPLVCAGLVWLMAWPILAQVSAGTNQAPDVVSTDQDAMESMGDFDIEQLVNLKVTSVGKKEQDLANAPAAVYVLTQEDIQRSGATSIPEALRLVPGLQVARVDANTWAISSRGFNDVFANKLLVMIDGRSTYTPLFAGVYWDVQDTMLEDIDRIEVIRGPGGTLWGANAVNGVINIITKSARATQRTLVSGGAGTQETGFGSARYGGQMGPNAWYRVYGKYFSRDNFDLPDGGTAHDRWSMVRGGFRIDWEPQEINRFTFQGDIYGGELDQVSTLPSLTAPFMIPTKKSIDVAGGNFLGRWTHTLLDGGEIQLQSYYDRTERDEEFYSEDRDTFDLEAQHHFQLGDRHDIVWGVGYRVTSDSFGSDGFTAVIDPDDRTDHLFSAFVQDEITLVEDRLAFTLGSKLEHNDYSDWEVQPNARLLWTPHHRHSLWTSVSRAVRTPSRSLSDIRFNSAVIPGVPPTLISIFGSDDLDSESQIAYELGYRVRPLDWLSVDVAAFVNDYEDLVATRTGTPFFEATPPPPHTVVPMNLVNGIHGETYGIEWAVTTQIIERWRIRGGYTYLESDLRLDSGGKAGSLADPRHQFFIHSSLDVTREIHFDAVLRGTDRLKNDTVSSYVELDLRLAWRPTENLELAVVGQNLLDSSHPEFLSESFSIQQTEVPRGVYGKITFRY